MPFVSVTRLRVKSIFYILFMRANKASVKELKTSKGLFKGKELIDKNLTFWTITKWNNEASYIHWIQEGDESPSQLNFIQLLIVMYSIWEEKLQFPLIRVVASF